MGRVGLMLCVAVPLAAADLAVKATVPTQPWAYHTRSLGWLVLSYVIFLAMLALARIPSWTVAVAAGVLAAGLLGNGLSAAWNGMRVPNPLIVGGEVNFVAFNLADVFALLGILAVVVTLGTWLIRNRALLPEPHEVRATRGRAFRRLLESPESISGQ